jgi:hypothetical protein
MDTLIDAIRAALADGATDDTKRAGANACRAILAALDAEPGASLAPAAPAINATMITALGRMDLNQLLDVAIARLRVLNAANSNAAPPTPSRGVSFPLVPVPHVGGGDRDG